MLTILYPLSPIPNLFAASAKKAAPQPSSGEGQMPEVIIKGGDKSGVKSEKPPLDFQMNPDEAVLPAMGVEAEPLKRQPESLRNPRAGFAEYLANDKTILPARVRLAIDPVKVFYPLREILAVSPSLSQEIGPGWEMVVTDSEGRSFRKYSGRGLPPGSLPWNGRSDRGEFAGVGKTYSMVINYKDTRGQRRNFVGEPFSFDGMIHQEPQGITISLNLAPLFETKKVGEKESLSESGMSLLKEASDWIKRYYFTYPLHVQCFSADQDLAGARAELFAKALGAQLLLPRPEIPADGGSSDASSERLEIIITNR